jgi:hypothetical protein
MTPRRRAALRKAQLASARKRRGTGLKKRSINKRKAVKYAGVAAVAVGAGAMAYKNRENLVIKHVAVHRAMKQHRKDAKSVGRKVSLDELKYIKQQERYDHAHRSTYRVREYRAARKVAQLPSSRGKSLRPDRKNSAWNAGNKVTGHPTIHHRYVFEAYRKDVHSRALSRHARMTGKKRNFNYSSGKRLLVNQQGKVKRTFW